MLSCQHLIWRCTNRRPTVKSAATFREIELITQVISNVSTGKRHFSNKSHGGRLKETPSCCRSFIAYSKYAFLSTILNWKGGWWSQKPSNILVLSEVPYIYIQYPSEWHGKPLVVRTVMGNGAFSNYIIRKIVYALISAGTAYIG